MPIKPENKKLYPANWKEISERIRFERAGGKCEWCGARHRATGFRSVIDGKFYEHRTPSLVGRKAIKIILTCAHLDHNPTNNADDNLAALCQKCHLTYDAKHHAANAAKTRAAKKEKGSMFKDVK